MISTIGLRTSITIESDEQVLCLGLRLLRGCRLGESAQLTLEQVCSIANNAVVGDEVKTALLPSSAIVTNDGGAFDVNTVEVTDTPGFTEGVKVQGTKIDNNVVASKVAQDARLRKR